jgi:predicted alpha/beta superfamily hydrolase
VISSPLCAAPTEPQVERSRIDSVMLSMPQLGHQKRIWIYLPQGYSSDGPTRYPVLYMQDGQDLFDPSPVFTDNPYILDSMRRELGAMLGWYGNWQIDKRLDGLFAERALGSIIVVGVSSDGGNRTAEYSPWPWPGASAAEGQEYADFVVHTLKPYIDHTYSTLTGRAHTGIAGSSMGGLIALYTGLRFQDVFSKIAAISPLLTAGPLGQLLVEFVRGRGRSHPMKIYVDLGTKESSFGPLEPLHGALRAVGFAEQELWFRRVDGGMHRIDHWGKRFPEALLWLYLGKTLPSS